MPSCTIELSKKQILFMKSKKGGIIFRGGIRSGKTKVACYKAIMNALRGRRQLMISYTYKNLKDAVLFTLKQCLEQYGLVSGEDYKINISDMIVLIGTTEILLRSGDNPDSIRGIEVSDVFIDESREFPTNEIFLVAIGRMSESEDGQWHITSSPKGKDWTWKLKEDDIANNIDLIVQRTLDNPFLHKSYYENVRSNYTTKFASQELEANIEEMSSGVINGEWFNVVNPIVPSSGVRGWDTAVTIKTSSDFSAGALCAMINGRFTICNIIHDKFTYPALRTKIIDTALIDGNKIIIGMEASGQSVGFVDDIRSTAALARHTIKAYSPDGDKLARALPWISRAEGGMVDMCRGAFNDNFKNECNDFTGDMSHAHDDMCFVAGTMIATPSGNRSIETLKIGDSVITPLGINKVKSLFCNEKEVVHNIGLIGTGNHPIISRYGNLTISLDAVPMLYYKSITFSLTLKEQLKWMTAKLLFMMDSSFSGSDVDITIIRELSTKKDLLQLCIDIFGKNIINKKYQKVLLFTILMVTSTTTTLIIYSCYQIRNILNLKLEFALKHKKIICSRLGHLLKSGTHQMREENGIEKHQKKPGIMGMLSKLKLVVKNVVRSFCPISIIPSFALHGAIKGIGREKCQENYISNVSYVEKTLNLKGYIQRSERHVAESAILNSELTKSTKVYNLSIEKCPLYYANGILVHNCDAVSIAYQLLNRPVTTTKHTRLY